MERYARLGASDVRAAAMPFSAYDDKRSRGRALIVGGSAKYHGAPVLCAISALRIGAGYAKLLVPSIIINPVRALSPNIIVGELGHSRIAYGKAALSEIERCDAMAIGMGIGNGEAAAGAAGRLIGAAAEAGKNVIVDADAIYALKRLKCAGNARKRIIATPNGPEFERLCKRRLGSIGLEGKVELASQCARELGITVVLKGHSTVVTDGRRTKVCTPKSSALATMGTGDVLAGMICGLCARGAGAFEAAGAGVYLHCAIGDMLERIEGNHAIATDAIDLIPSVIKDFDKIIH